jgi:uncharacterized protein (TIGR03435 family)
MSQKVSPGRYVEGLENSMVLRRWIGAILAVAVASVCFAQSVDPSLTFEVASVKPTPPPTSAEGKRMIRIGAQGGPGTGDPGQISYSFVSLRNLLTEAFGLKMYQISGQDWMDSERFDIIAKVPSGATKDEVKIMLQNLLKERFQLAFHFETKVIPVYELVVGKNGPKLKESLDQSDPAAVPSATPPSDGAATANTPPPLSPPDPSIKVGKDGMPEFPPGMQRPGIRMMATMSPTGFRVRLNAQRQTMAQLADSLSNQVDRPVLDRTGLASRYDFTLDFAPDQSAMMTKMGTLSGGMPPPSLGSPVAEGGREPAPNASVPGTDAAPLFVAIQSQLGLKLEAKKAPTDLIVVDHLKKTPSEN